MASFEENRVKKVEVVTKERFDTFVGQLRSELISVGLDGPTFDVAVGRVLNAMRNPEKKSTFGSEQSAPRHDSRGVDSLGRILVEFCFMRSSQAPLIWPDNSEKDGIARRMFTDDCIPRPLMRYFLASVRGSNPKIDAFQTDAVLLHDAPIRRSLDQLLEEFKGPFGDGESAIQWDEVYADPRSQALALELVRLIRKKVADFGTDNYLAVLEGYRKRDPDSTGINAMQRAFSLNDAKLIEDALERAQDMLEHRTN